MIYNAKILINSYIQYINNKKYTLQKKNNYTFISSIYIQIDKNHCQSGHHRWWCKQDWQQCLRRMYQSFERDLYRKAGGMKMFFKFGIRRIIRLTRFNIEIEQIGKRYRDANDGYLMAFATRLDKQGQHYGKPLMTAF